MAKQGAPGQAPVLRTLGVALLVQQSRGYYRRVETTCSRLWVKSRASRLSLPESSHVPRALRTHAPHVVGVDAYCAIAIVAKESSGAGTSSRALRRLSASRERPSPVTKAEVSARLGRALACSPIWLSGPRFQRLGYLAGRKPPDPCWRFTGATLAT